MQPVDPEAFRGTDIDGLKLGANLPNSSLGFLYVAGEAPSGNIIRIMRMRKSALQPGTTMALLVSMRDQSLVPYVRSGVADAGVFRGAAYFVRRNVRNTLARLSNKHRSEMRAETIFKDVLKGISVLHRNGLIHGALRPSNIALNGRGRFILLDFGLTDIAQLDVYPSSSRRDFDAPEARDLAWTPASDVYSAAISALSVHPGVQTRRDALDLVSKFRREGRMNDSWAGIFEACLLSDPTARPTTEALLDFAWNDGIQVEGDSSERLRHHLYINDPDFLSRVAARLATSMPPEDRSSAKDFVQDAIAKVLARAQEEPDLSVQLSASGALMRYTLISAQHSYIDHLRRTKRMLLVSDADLVNVDSATFDPISDLHRASEALEAISAEIGPQAMRVLWLRANGRSYGDIAAEVSLSMPAITPLQAFIVIYRLRRAYPEIDELIPVDSAAESESFLFKWLGNFEFNADQRELIASLLAGVSVDELADRFHTSSSTVRRRMRSLAQTSTIARVLLDTERPVPAELDSAGIALSEARRAPQLRNLAPDWVKKLREEVDESVAALLQDPQSVAESTDQLVERLLNGIREVDELQSNLLSYPKLTIASLARLRSASQKEVVQDITRARIEGKIIVLSDGTQSQLPAFQFTSTGRLNEVVERVNLKLGATEDPWGAAGWWLQVNGRLPNSASPSSLLGSRDDLISLLADAIDQDV